MTSSLDGAWLWNCSNTCKTRRGIGGWLAWEPQHYQEFWTAV